MLSLNLIFVFFGKVWELESFVLFGVDMFDVDFLWYMLILYCCFKFLVDSLEVKISLVFIMKLFLKLFFM